MTEPTPDRPDTADPPRLRHQPSLGRGLVWSEFVRAMEKEWEDREPASLADRDRRRAPSSDVVGEAA